MFPHALSVVKKLVEAKKNWLIVGKGPNYDKEDFLGKTAKNLGVESCGNIEK